MKSPIHAIDGEYIREWLVLGPFLPDNLETDFLAGVGGERHIQPQEGDTVNPAAGRGLTWKHYTDKGNIVDLIKAVGNHECATAYAACILQNEVDGDAQILGVMMVSRYG